ncbi:MAG: glutaredoxin family protein [Chloroflexota bacterium]
MAATPPLPDLVLYSRPGCRLCDDARRAIQSILEDRAARGLPAPHFRERDITTEPALERAFFEKIPVVELGEERLELAIAPARLRRWIGDRLDRVVA